MKKISVILLVFSIILLFVVTGCTNAAATAGGQVAVTTAKVATGRENVVYDQSLPADMKDALKIDHEWAKDSTKYAPKITLAIKNVSQEEIVLAPEGSFGALSLTVISVSTKDGMLLGNPPGQPTPIVVTLQPRELYTTSVSLFPSDETTYQLVLKYTKVPTIPPITILKNLGSLNNVLNVSANLKLRDYQAAFNFNLTVTNTSSRQIKLDSSNRFYVSASGKDANGVAKYTIPPTVLNFSLGYENIINPGEHTFPFLGTPVWMKDVAQMKTFQVDAYLGH